jgi:hypothetical protein
MPAACIRYAWLAISASSTPHRAVTRHQGPATALRAMHVMCQPRVGPSLLGRPRATQAPVLCVRVIPAGPYYPQRGRRCWWPPAKAQGLHKQLPKRAQDRHRHRYRNQYRGTESLAAPNFAYNRSTDPPRLAHTTLFTDGTASPRSLRRRGSPSPPPTPREGPSLHATAW